MQNLLLDSSSSIVGFGGEADSGSGKILRQTDTHLLIMMSFKDRTVLSSTAGFKTLIIAGTLKIQSSLAKQNCMKSS